jgi:ech hydrogenase subunit D
MKQEQTIIPIDVGNLIGNVEQCRDEGYRLAQIGCTKVGDNAFEINYSFDKDFVLKNLRITVTAETEVPSITGMYWGAFAYENEMHDLFGIQVKGINIDFKGTFIRTAIKHPFGVSVSKGEKP